jgi:hypothetical protein
MVPKGSAVAAAAAALLTLAAGCGKAPRPVLVEAGGTVRLDGKPLKNAEVRFIPPEGWGPEYVASGVTDGAGRFQLTCKGQPGACAGENRVLVLEAEIPGRLLGEDAQVELAKYFRSLGGRPIPPRYGNLAESPLKADVKAGQKEYRFELTQ